MEDAATVEISRSQIWQQVKNSVKFEDSGEICTAKLVSDVLEQTRIKLVNENHFEPQVKEAVKLFREISLADDFPEFITTKASELIDKK
jgi:malate synthase